MKKLDCTVAILLLIAALNWGLVGVFNFDLIDAMFESPILDRMIYGVFGLSAIYILVSWHGLKQRWMR